MAERELLLRMIGPVGERVTADRFMQPAEDFGLAPEVDDWVLRHLAPLLGDQARRDADLRVAVNLSGQTAGT